MHRLNPFRSKLHQESSHRNKTIGRSKSSRTDSNQSLQISAPIISCNDKIIIPDEEQTTSIENEDLEEQISVSEETETMSARYEHEDDQVD